MTDPHDPWRPPAATDEQPAPGDGEDASATGSEDGFEQPRRHVPAFPTIPAGSGAGGRDDTYRRSTPRVGLIALVASLLGGLVAGAVTVATLERDGAPAGVTVQEQPTQAPVITVQEGRTQVEAVAEAVLPTVVQIDIGGESAVGTANGNGSGVIYRSDGYIITNNHVVAGDNDIQVVFADGTRERADVVGRDVLSDIAVIRVGREDLTAIQVGDSSRLRVGQLAVAIGSPFGLEGSVTAGVISAINRPISVGDGIRLPNVIQTDAPINPGNSGGALVGADGRLIGINSAILTAGSPANAGVGFAVPVATAVDIADELINSGSVIYPYLGVEGSNVPTAAADRLGVEQGALVTAVQDDTPADDSGLRMEDVVIQFDGTEITSMDDLIVAVRQADVGDTVEVVYIRNREEQAVEVTLVERPVP